MKSDKVCALTPLQEKALLDAKFVKFSTQPGRWETDTPRAWKALIGKGLAYFGTAALSWRHGYDRAILNEKGIAARNALLARAQKGGAA